MSAALCGLALIFALDWELLLIIPSFIIMHFAVVRREELWTCVDAPLGARRIFRTAWRVVGC